RHERITPTRAQIMHQWYISNAEWGIAVDWSRASGHVWLQPVNVGIADRLSPDAVPVHRRLGHVVP
ncbi:MAG: hypothetical protein ACJ73E_06215, partial [Mycobacteriales bacterium]